MNFEQQAQFIKVYSNPYIRGVIDTLIKALTVLAAVSLDVGLLFWIRGLRMELDKRLKDIEKQKQKL